MNKYKFSIFKRPKLIDFYKDFAKVLKNVKFIIYGFDNGDYKVFEISSNQFRKGAFTQFIEDNPRLRVKRFTKQTDKTTIFCF